MISGINLWNETSGFFDKVATTQGYDRESLSLAFELRNGGPTAFPSRTVHDSNVEKRVVVRKKQDMLNIPSACYDSLGSRHIDITLTHTRKGEKLNVPQRLFSFQHAPFFGNCRICIHRWVRVEDPKEWDDTLRRAALRWRAVFAAQAASCKLLVVSTGDSFHGAEFHTDFKSLYEGEDRSIHLLNLREYLSV